MGDELPWTWSGFEPGMQIARYRLEDRVGQGGMAVYREPTT